MLNHSASLVMSISLLNTLPGKLDIKRHSPSILYDPDMPKYQITDQTQTIISHCEKEMFPHKDKQRHALCVDPERGRGSGPPPLQKKAIGFFSNTGTDPLKNHKATKPAFNGGPSSAC